MHATRSRALALLVSLALFAGLATTSLPAAPARAETTAPAAPVATPPGVTTFDVPAASGTPADAATGVLVAARPATEATFNQVALSWAEGGSATLVAQVRVRTGGAWGEWLTLDVTAGDRGRIGTELAFVGASEAAEARVLSNDGTTGSGFQLTLIDSNALPAVSGPEPRAGFSALALNATRSDQVVTDVPAPAIVTREQWGANPAYWNTPKDPECAAPISNVQGAVVHHTAGSNSYTQAEAPGVVRGIYYYHAVQLAWCDIGYNFLVDKFGTIYQGRVGDLQQAVWGAHATYVNGRSVGVSYLGETTAVAPTAAGVKSIADVIAWRFGRYDKLPSDTAMYYSNGNPDPQPAITGHGYLKYHSTSCPGTGLKNQMDNIRAMVASRLTRYTLTWDALPTYLESRTVKLTGRVAAGLSGYVGFDVTAPDGTFIGGAASAPLAADGSFATTWTMPTGWSGTATITAHFTVPGAGTLYGEQAVATDGGISLQQPGAVSLVGQVPLSGSITPPIAGTTLTVWGADAGGYTERLGTTTADAAGNWSFSTGFGGGTTQTLTFWATGTIAGSPATSNKVTVTRLTVAKALTIAGDTAFLGDDMLLYGGTVPSTPGTTVNVYGRLPGGEATWLGDTVTRADGTWWLWTSMNNNSTTPFEAWATSSFGGTTQSSERIQVAYSSRRIVLDAPNPVPVGQSLTLTGRMYLPGAWLGVDVWGRLPGGAPVKVGSVVTDSNGEFRLSTPFGATSVEGLEFWATSPAALESNHIETRRTGAADTTQLPGSLFRPSAPSRIVDTRNGIGGRMGAFQPWAGTDFAATGVPAGASAVVLNVTAVAPTAAGYATVHPAGTPVPTASNLNFTPGQTVANQVTVPLVGGRFALANGSPGLTHFVVDVAGWYMPQDGRPAGSYVPLPTPTRLVDSRANLNRSGALAPGATLNIPIAGQMGMPRQDIAAVALNVTSVGPSASGHLTVYPHGADRPTASNVNLVPGADVPNAVVVKVGADGTIDLINASMGSTHIVVDVVGYYVAGTPTASGAFVALAPSRVMDTRSGLGVAAKLQPDESAPLAVVNAGGVAPSAGAVVLNATVTEPTASGYLALSPAGQTVPIASNLNFVADQTVANLTTTKVGTNGQLLMTNGSGGTTHAIADVAGYFIR